MTQENSSEQTADISEKPVKVESASDSVVKEVAEVVGKSHTVARQRLIDIMVERELVKRVDLLDKSLNKVKDLRKEISKVRPVDQFDMAGKKVSGFLTKEQHESLSKSKEKLTRFESAIEKALSGEGFDKLTELMSKEGNNFAKDAPKE